AVRQLKQSGGNCGVPRAFDHGPARVERFHDEGVGGEYACTRSDITLRRAAFLARFSHKSSKRRRRGRIADGNWNLKKTSDDARERCVPLSALAAQNDDSRFRFAVSAPYADFQVIRANSELAQIAQRRRSRPL